MSLVLAKSFVRCCFACVFSLLVLEPSAFAQMTMSSAIRMAMENGPRVKAAQSDLTKAQTGLSVVKDLYIPSVVTTAGVGDSYGITLTVPTIFTVGAQSLIYSAQQRFSLRAAHSDLLAAGLALTEARDEVEEDAAITYVNLDESQTAAAAIAEQYRHATKLLAIVRDRRDAGLDSEIEFKKAERGALQIKLAQLQMQDGIEAMRAHLAQLTGAPVAQVRIVPESIPKLPSPDSFGSEESEAFEENPGILAAEANAEGRLDRAKGDARYAWRPTITFGAQYGRVSPINNVSEFYNLHGIYNTVNAGIQIQFPLLDLVRKAAARQSFADVARAQVDVGNLRAQLADDRQKLRRSLPELSIKAQVAELDFEIARNDLQSTLTRAHSKDDVSPLNPKDEENAHIEERQKFLDYLEAKMEYAKAEIWLLRQTGRLASWIETPPASPQSGTSSSPQSVKP